ncbi:MAG: nucleoside triphosphate pyrophosphohydrolase [Clostridiales bacterium]|nr:nucleoside triphosphate pyrophosphohydrolase [Clostridiales bacterium]
MGIVYNKLVRDRIPEIIEASGRTCATRILPEGEYLLMLEAKLDEELAEFHKDRTLEELADLMEVIRAIAVARGCPPEELERIRAGKADARGGFADRIFLEEVSE